MTNKTNSIFDKFTRKYQLSKTLRFELRPVGKTADFLKQNKIFEKDQTIDDSYNQAKFYFDMIHREFIESALGLEKIKSISFGNFAKIFYEQNKIIKQKKSEKKDVKNKEDKNKIQKEINGAENKINDARKNLYKQIRKIFGKESVEFMKAYKKDKGKNEEGKIEKSILFSKDILSVLKERFPKEKNEEFQKEDWPSLYVKDKINPAQERYIFDSFDKFTTYLTKFQQTRKNLYADHGENTSVISRIVSNFEIFLKNNEVFKEKYSKNYKEIGFPANNVFEIDYYLNCLIQKRIEKLENPEEDKTSYNKIIGETNKRIKEYRDKNKKEKNETPLFKKLEKQILGRIEKEKELIRKTKDKSENEVFLEKFKEFIKENKKRIPEAKDIINLLVLGEFESEYSGIYLKRQAINTISRRWFSDYQNFLLELPQSSKSKEEKSEPKIKKFVSLKDIKDAVFEMDGDIFKEKYYKKDENDQEGVISREENKWRQFLKIWQYEFNNLFKDKKEGEKAIYGYNSSLGRADELKSFSKKKKEIPVVKNYCDSALKIYQMMQYFDLGDKEKKSTPSDFSTDFYAQFDEYYKDFAFIKYYNTFRNYLIKKPYSEEKIKLNFDCGQLLGGFDKNKEKEKLGIILRKNCSYYLGIINQEHSDIFDEEKNNAIYQTNSDSCEKMEYKLFPDPKRMIPKIAFAENNKKEFGWTQEIQDIKDEYEKFQEQKKSNRDFWKNKFDKSKTIKLIAYYQQCLERGGYKKTFDFCWKTPSNYSGIGEFNDDIAKQNYHLRFRKIDGNYVDLKIDKGELYLFQIHNKDFSDKAEGIKNVHSLYFLKLFDEKNLDNVVLRLSGNAEVFYREASMKPKKEIRGIHKKREVIKYKRYTEPKIFFHVPILINTNAGGTKANNFNREVNKFLAENKSKVNIIGIDRGEKNLLYYCVINQEGEILEQGSLNEINKVNYFEKLIEREQERQLNRQSWQPVAKIKDLKKGYISHAIKKVCDLIEKYNAIVVLEDLNMRFKQIRSGIERAVYQQFEKALIDKLGYLVFKDNRDIFAPGGVLNGYQLAAPFVSFKKIGKQTGIIFYTNAEYTSQTDPVTGFRKNIYISNSASLKKIKDALEKFKAVGWDAKEQSYYFVYCPADFDKNVFNREWMIYSKIPRVRREKDKKSGYWEYKKIDLNKEFRDLFKKYGFETEKQDILPDIKNKIKTDDKSLMKKKEFDGKLKNFYERFIYLFNLVLQIRNTYSLSIKIDDENNKLKEIDYGVDFIASPVKPFFTTLGKQELGKRDNKEEIKKEIKEIYTKANFATFRNKFIGSIEADFDSDGVGAYNIARKGIIILKNIKKNPNVADLYIFRSDWDEFAIENALTG
jgi:hypothetical protein